METGKLYQFVLNGEHHYKRIYFDSSILGKIEVEDREKLIPYLNNEAYEEDIEDSDEDRIFSRVYLHIVLTDEQEATVSWPIVKERYERMSKRYTELTTQFNEEVDKLSDFQYVRNLSYEAMSIVKDFLPPIKSRYTKYDRFRINLVQSLLRRYNKSRIRMPVNAFCAKLQAESKANFDIYKLYNNKQLVEYKEVK